MARAFTIRPFNKKKDSKGNEIDFEDVHNKLIGPAIDAAGLGGGTTVEIIEAGNIREDMFELICTADVVIADISIHNANVFYELGIRHAVREKRTVLINNGADDVPFDLLTDRYCWYDVNAPEAYVDELVKVLEATIKNENPDSPVFKMLPGLQSQHPERLMAVPRDFREAVWAAERERNTDELAAMAHRVRDDKPKWEAKGLRLAAQALFGLQVWPQAAEAWEAVRRLEPTDIEANSRLGTIYAKIDDLTASDQALLRIHERQDATPDEIAELRSLEGSNAKTRWLADWQSAADTESRREAALMSPFLLRSIDAYENGFQQDLNHYYSGLNALALVTVRVELAEANPDLWESELDEDEDGARLLAKEERRRTKLEAMVEASIEAALARNERQGKEDPWLLISQADLKSLTSGKPGVVAKYYRNALARAGDQALGSVERQLRIYEKLGIREKNVAAALEVIEHRKAAAG
jgi:hypothetical protein